MRRPEKTDRYNPAKVRSRRQWTVFGSMAGIALALMVNVNTGWIARKELATGLPLRNKHATSILSVEYSNYIEKDPDAIAAASAIARDGKSPLSVRIAATIYTALAAMPQAAQGAEPRYSEDLQAVELQKLLQANPQSPLVAAGCLQVAAHVVQIDRPECSWLTGSDYITPRGQLGGVALPGAFSTKARAAMDNKDRLIAMQKAAEAGIASDPRNAYFYMMLAYVEFQNHLDSAAIDHIDAAAHADRYNDYAGDLASGWQQLDMAVYGRQDALTDSTFFFSQGDYRTSMMVRNVAQVAVWKAIELEHSGKVTDSVPLRMRIAAVGALEGRYRPNAFNAGTTANLIVISALGAGGVFISRPEVAAEYSPGSGNTGEPPYHYAQRCADAYLIMLHKHGFDAVAAWYKPIFKAQFQVAAGQYYANSASGAYDESLEIIEAKILLPAGYLLVAQIVFVALAGGILALIGYRKRFVPRKEVYWSRSQWGAVFAGCAIAVFCTIGCSILYTNSSAWPIAAVVLCAVGVIQLILRNSNYSGTHAGLMLNTLCVSVCAIMVACISAIGVSNWFGALNPDPNSGPRSALEAVMPFAVWLLIVPAITLFCVFGIHRVRYQAIPSGMYYGLRSAILPLLSILLVVWSASVVVTAGQDMDYRAKTLQEVGLLP